MQHGLIKGKQNNSGFRSDKGKVKDGPDKTNEGIEKPSWQ
jgi:hypothetical protein